MSRRFLFLIADESRAAPAELLAMVAASALTEDTTQVWLQLQDATDKQLMDQTLMASDAVMVTGLQAQTMARAAYGYLAHWPSWGARRDIDFGAWVAGKAFWSVSAGAGTRSDAKAAGQPLHELASAHGLHWGGAVWAHNAITNGALADVQATQRARTLFADAAARTILLSPKDAARRAYLAACQTESS